MDNAGGQIKFGAFNAEHATQVAKLHVEGLPEAFITELGLDFTVALYDEIAKSDASFGFVAEDNGKVLGFVIFTPNLTRLYKDTVVKIGMRCLPFLFKKMLSPRRILNLFETLTYPWKIKKMNLPSTGLIAIAVAKEARGRGVGKTLILMGFDECRNRGIEKVRVLVGSANDPAQALYLKCGFKKVLELKRHQRVSVIYVADIRKKQPSTGGKTANNFAQFLKACGDYMLTVGNTDWYKYQGFMIPAYLPHCCPEITTNIAAKVLEESKCPFVRWQDHFGETHESQWWFVLKRGPWQIDSVKDKKKRWMIRQGAKNFTVRLLTSEEVTNLCPAVAQAAATRYKGEKDIETREILEKRLNAAKKVPGFLEYFGCFEDDKLASFSENYIQDNAVWLVSMRHDPAFLNKYSSYGFIDGLLNYYLDEKKLDYILDGSRTIHHKTEFQDHLIRVFGFSKEYAVLNILYSPAFGRIVKMAYPLRKFIWVLSDKLRTNFLDNAGAILKQEYIIRTREHL